MTRNGDDRTQHLLEAVIEHFDEKIKVVTDGHLMLAEKIDRVASELRSEMREQGELLRAELRAEIQGGDAALREELRDFRIEVKNEFTELRAMMKLSYAEIDARFTRLETTVGELEARLDRLERRTAS